MKIYRYKFALTLLICAFASNFDIANAGRDSAPPRALLVADHLKKIPFEAVSPGLSALHTLVSNGVEILAFAIKPTKFRFDVVEQANSTGEKVKEIGSRSNALMSFNGGFFSVDKKGAKLPVGLLARNGTPISQAWKKTGGYLVVKGSQIAIQPTRGKNVPSGDVVLQSKPMLIEPGGKWAMNTNGAIPRKRTLMCMQKSGEVIVLAIIGGGMSLYEAGWLMRGEDVGGVFDCDSALALDGGGSTQVWVKDRPDLSFTGETPVQNAVVIQQR